MKHYLIFDKTKNNAFVRVSSYPDVLFNKIKSDSKIYIEIDSSEDIDPIDYQFTRYNEATNSIESIEPPSIRINEEAQINGIKDKRNLLLAETDWTQLPDVPDEIRLKYLAYRQALRDLPEQDGFPNITFPTKPE